MHHLEPHHKLSSIKKHPLHPNGSNHSSNQLLQHQHHRTMLLQQQQAKESKPCVYSITVDYGSSDETDSDSSPLPEVSQSYSWAGAMGMFFWSSTNAETSPSKVVPYGPFEGSPIGWSLPFDSPSPVFDIWIGSYGYLMHQNSNEATTKCPPDRIGWETLLISQAVDEAMDLTIDQIVSLACALVDSLGVRSSLPLPCR